MIAPVVVKLGEPVTLQGYADDYGNHIVALEFSLDEGNTWDVYDTSNSNPDLRIDWTYKFIPKEVGKYRLKVRSVTDDGRKSPMAAVAEIYVEEATSE